MGLPAGGCPLSLDTSWPALANAASGVLLIVLAACVWRLSPRGRAHRGFALFAGSFGLGLLPNNLIPYDATNDLAALHLVEPLLWLLAGAGLFLMVAALPRRARGDHRRTVRIAALLLVLAYAVSLASAVRTWEDTLAPLEGPLAAQWGVAAALHQGSLLTFGLLAAIGTWGARSYRWAGEGRSEHVATSALASLALAPYTGLAAGWFLSTSPSRGSANDVLTVGLFAMALATWLTAAVASRSTARGWSLVVPLVLAAGALYQATWGSFEGAQWGLARLLGVAVLGVAVVRHQVFGIELRLKWTFKQSTIAAILLAAFFVVSELAAALFSERLGTVAGIVAAGALIFAIAPLQGLAQRLADRAMPHAKETSEMDEDERITAYRRLAEAAWDDGVLDGRERVLLDNLRDELDLTHEVAATIESEAAPASGQGTD